MIQIQPIKIGLPSKEGTQLALRTEFTIGEDTSRLFWQIFDAENNQLGCGNIEVGAETHANWGEDDTIIEDYAINFLGLKRL